MRRLAYFALAFAAAVFLFVYAPVSAAFICAAAVIAAGLTFVLKARRPLKVRVITVSAGLLTGVLWCLLYSFVFLRIPVRLHESEQFITAAVLTYPDKREYMQSLRVSAASDSGTVRAELYIYGRGGADLRPGDIIELTADFSYQNGALTARSGGYTVTGHKSGVFYIPEEIARAVSDSISRIFPEEYAHFIRAVTIGDAHDLKQDTRLYSTLGHAGIAHIAAVSGMHVSFLIALAAALVKNKRALAVIGVPLLLIFMAAAGFSASVTRAVIMQTLLLTAPLLKRKTDGITSVSAALLLLLAVNPYTARNAGLQLSFASTLGIVLFSDRINTSLTAVYSRFKFAERKPVRRILRFITAGFSVTTGALAFSTPLLVYYFGYISVISPLTNLLTVWAASFMFCGGLIAGLLGIVSGAIGTAAAAVAVLPAAWIVFVAETARRVPFSSVYVSNPYVLIWLVYVYSAFAVFFLFRGRRRAVLYPLCGTVLLFAITLLLSAAGSGYSFTLTALNVGQGQCLVVSDGGRTVMIDCGSLTDDAARAADEFLQSQGKTTIDLLILTHFHTDHANGVPALTDKYKIGAIAVPEPAPDGESALAGEIIMLAKNRGTDIIYVTEQTEIVMENSAAVVLPPVREVPGDENAACLSILVMYGDWEALVTGDMDVYGEMALTEIYSLPDIELLIAGHHGSKYSVSELLLDTVTPETAIISVGKNSYGHPSPEALERLAAHGAAVCRTDEIGHITIRP